MAGYCPDLHSRPPQGLQNQPKSWGAHCQGAAQTAADTDP